MKKHLLIVLFAALCFEGSAQWNINGNYYISGKVGVGTATPVGKLEVYGGGDLTIRALDFDAGDLVFLKNDQTQLGRIWTHYSGQNSERLQFSSSDNVADITIGPTGNVCIGAGSALNKLDVNGSILENAENSALGIDGQTNARLGLIKKSGYGPVIASDNANPIIFSQTNQTGIHTNISGATLTERMRISANGNVGIGTANPDQKLTVNGIIHTVEVIIDPTVPAPDYVFEKDYDLRPIEEVKIYIDQNKHLPEVPSAKEMEKDGVKTGEMNMLLLKKVEELTLYLIEQNTKIELLQKQVEELKVHAKSRH